MNMIVEKIEAVIAWSIIDSGHGFGLRPVAGVVESTERDELTRLPG